MIEANPEIISFVDNILGDDFSGHDVEHAKRVYNNASLLIKKEGGNPKIIYPACLLHDCIDEKIIKDVENNKELIKKLLIDLDYQEDEVDKILQIIDNISFRKNSQVLKDDIDFRIVQDADRLDAIGAIGIIRTISYGTSVKRKFYEEANLKEENGKITFNKSSLTSLSHFYDKLLKLEGLMNTNTAKKIARRRTNVLKEFLDEFYLELEGK